MGIASDRQLILRVARAVFVLACGVVLAERIQAQAVQSDSSGVDSPIHLVLPTSPGGSSDFLARALEKQISALYRSGVWLSYRPGATGSIGTMSVVNSSARESLFLLQNSAYHIAYPAWSQVRRWDPITSFSPVAFIAAAPQVFVLRSGHQAKDFGSLVEAHKVGGRTPLRVANSGFGGISHISAEILCKAARIECIHVPYKGAGPAVQDLLAGHVDAIFTSPPSVVQHVRDGKLQLLLTTERVPISPFSTAPELRSVLPGVEVPRSWFGVFASKEYAPQKFDAVERGIRAMIDDSEFRRAALDHGLVPALMTRSEFLEFIKKDSDYVSTVMSRYGVRQPSN
jgi:tripartite-type tricarboxylate transporter receptor subunit TctC